MKTLFKLLIVLILIGMISCESTEPEPDKFNLTVKNYTREAHFRINKVPSTGNIRTAVLYRGDSVIWRDLERGDYRIHADYEDYYFSGYYSIGFNLDSDKTATLSGRKISIE